MKFNVYLILIAGLGILYFSSDLTAGDDPMFIDLPYEVTIYENVTLGTVIFTASANDSDEGILIFNIGIGNQERKFTVDAQTGDVRIGQPLDREETNEYRLALRVVNRNTNNKTIGLLTVNVLDNNDNPPVCTPYRVLGELNESDPVNTTFTFINCTDVDVGFAGQLDYEVTSGDTDVIGINENGTAFLTRTVDYEAGRDTYEVVVLVKDRGVDVTLSTITTVVLSLQDVDDNAPVFSSVGPYTATVPEDTPVGTTILNITATDADKPTTAASRIEFQFATPCSPDVLLIDRFTGRVIVKTDLDFESNQTITCTVTASSSGTSGPSNTTDVIVTVTDVNDRVPTFKETFYQGSVLENKGNGTLVAKVSADDPDMGPDGEVSYSIASTIFRIDPTSGEVVLNIPLDFETDPSILTAIIATDAGNPPKNSTVFLQVTIEPENEFTPTFQGTFEFEVPEDAVPGTSVFTVNATDDDLGLDGSVSYEIEQGFPFFIDVDTGIVRVAQILDFETKPNVLTFMVTATDNSTTSQRSASATLTATILDVNDVAVTCDPVPTQTVTFPFTLGNILFSLACDDPDLVASNLTYIFSEGNDDGTFKIDKNKGNVTLANIPQNSLYNLTVIVDDGVDSVNVSFFVIAETMLNFTNLPATIGVEEDTPTTVRLIFKAQTCCSFSAVSLSFVSGNNDNKVALFGSSGDIYLLVPYDRETVATYVYEIQAQTTDGQSVVGELTVNVLDINDHTPTFSDNVYQVSVMEDLPLNTIIYQVTAMDGDEGINSLLDYNIMLGNTGNTFSINSTGHIELIAELDYETLTSYTLVIEAFDAGASSRTGTTSVVISVKNADEFQPELVPVGPYFATLSEDEALGRSVFHVQARDNDTNIAFTYSITSGNDDGDFSIVPDTGYIFLSKLLDRERAPTYNLTLTATDQNWVTENGTLDITITDINDNNPVFSSAVYNYNISHGAVLGETLVVSDADSGVNAVVSVSIKEESLPGAFTLTGLELVSTFTADYMVTKNYRIVVKAVDGGIPQRTSTAVVTVNVLPDLTMPSFSANTSDTVTYNEDVNVGFQIYDVDATSLGAVENDGSMSYVISSGDLQNDFRIGQYNGQIVVNRALDYENIEKYTLVIVARSTADPMNTATFTLTVSIVNVNEHSPVFVQDSFSFDVDEHAGASTSVGTVNASDADSGILGAVSHSISGNEFCIDPTSGEIQVRGSLDYQTKSYYNLIVNATDGSTTSPKVTLVSVVIRVRDVNDNPPVFVSDTSVQILDSIPVGSEVFQFRATDIDTGNVISYSIGSPDPSSGKFDLDSDSGILRTAALLDSTTSSYVLPVVATDGGSPAMSATTSLTITIMPVNPNFNDPVFSLSDPVSVIAPRQSVMGADVVTILATDADSGSSGEILFKITSGNIDGYFIMDESSGKITAATALLNADDTYSLTVVAKDKGTPQRNSSITVNIRITPPETIGLQSDYQFSIDENAGIGTTVGRIDKDGGRNVSSYILRSGNSNNEFAVAIDGSEDGIITVNSPLDYELYQTYSLLIDAVTDIGDLPKVVEIQVNDLNDNPPTFASSTLTLSVYENMPIGHTVETISYTDADTLEANTNNKLSLENPGPSYFQLDQDGHLSLIVVLDHETNPQIIFEVVVDDSISSATVTVTCSILDVEETEEVSPSTVTESALISLEVPYQATSGHLIHTLTPGDFGMTTSVTATYEYVSYDSSDPFSVDASTGQLTVSNPSLLEDQSKYFHWVMCRARDSSGISSKVSLIRIDTFNMFTQMIVIELAEALSTVQSNINSFRYRTQAFFSSTQRVGFSNLIDTSTSSRRRLLASQTAAYTYVVSDTSADDMANINQAKTFMSGEDILAVLQQSVDGTPSPGLTSSSLNVATVEPFQETESSDSSFVDSTGGIVVFALLGLLVLVAIILLVWCCCFRKGKKDSVDPKERERINSSDTVHPVVVLTPNGANKGAPTKSQKSQKNSQNKQTKKLKKGQPPMNTHLNSKQDAHKLKTSPSTTNDNVVESLGHKGKQLATKSKGTTTADMFNKNK